MVPEKSTLETSPPEKLSGFEWWRRSLLYRLNLGISESERAQFEHDYRHKLVEKNCGQCDEFRDWMIDYSPSVRFMMEHVNKLGGNLTKNNIICDKCDDLKGGGFHPKYGILLCSNWIQDKWQLEDILTHELVHAYDHLKFKVDLTNLKHHACTEIRASMLSGECRMMREIRKTGFGGFGGKFQDCIRRRAVISVAANPHCKDEATAQEVVDTVWKSCFNDTRPFERVYR